MTLVKFYPKNGQIRRNSNGFLGYSDLWNDFYRDGFERPSQIKPDANIREESDMYEIELALPGISKKDVKINIEKDILSISKEYKEENENENYSFREFNFASFERSFRLPDTIDRERIEAKMVNGILSIRLPKKKDAIDNGPRELKIS